MGISHSWNGTVLTITSDSGTSSADLKGDIGIRGPQGPAGDQYKPQYGVDYFTDAEKGAFLDEIDEHIVENKEALFLAETKEYVAENTVNAEYVGEYVRENTVNAEYVASYAAPVGHLADDTNPHGVTAEQVGARPNTWTPTAADVGTAEIKTLWVNAGAGWAFPAQTLPLDLTGYDCVEVVASVGELPNNFTTSPKVPIGQSGFVCGFGSDFWLHTRSFTVSTDGITFTSGAMQDPGGTIYNDWDGRSVPYKIYGIKEVQ